MSRNVFISIALTALLAVPAAAQYSVGDIVVGVQEPVGQTWPLHGVTPGGSVYTVTTGLPSAAWSMAVAPDNRSILVSGKGNGVYVTSTVAPDGTITNVIVDQFKIFFAMDVDDRGKLILAAPSRIYEFSNSQFSTIFQGAPLRNPQLGVLDPASGDMVVVQANGVFRINMVGTPLPTTVVTSLPVRPAGGGLHPDPASGTMVGVWTGGIYRVMLGAPGQLTTLRPLSVSHVGIDRDPTTGLFYISRGASIFAPADLIRYDAATNAVVSVARLPVGPQPTRCVIAGSRHLAAASTPAVGQSYQLRVSSPGEPGATYLVAASFGMSGIPLQPGKTVYLTPDALFRASLTNSGIFSNFRGVLDAQGEQIATLAIPNISGLRGLRFYLAAVTLSGGNFSTVSEPIGATIR